jgi:hypothetical protein
MLDALVGQDVIVDTDARFSYLGRLAAAGKDLIELEDVTIYDAEDARFPAEQYLVECVRFGRTTSRDRLWIPCQRVVAVSRLSDITIPS